MSKKEYEAKNIKILEGLDAVRTRPGMYIGTTGIKGLHHILWEIVDNAIDEAANGHGSSIEVEIHLDGSISVCDDGRGIPVDIHPTMGVSGVEVVFTQLHAGGKFDNDNYSHSGGLHGVGASVTNALSEWLKVEVYKHKTTYRMEFESRAGEDGKIKGGVPKYALMDTGIPSNKTGTFVQFKPDAKIFESVNFSFDTIQKRLKELAFLNRGVRIVLIDNRIQIGASVLRREYCFEGGIIDFVKYLNEAKTPVIEEPIHLTGEHNGISIELAMQHTDSYAENLCSYVNNIPTTEGGTHETGFKGALTKVMNDLAWKTSKLKGKDQNLTGDDYREGLTCVLSIKMQNVQFEGQTKTKLGNPEAKTAVDEMVKNALENYLETESGKPVAEILFKKAFAAMKVREAVRKEKEIARAKNSIEGTFNLVGKLSACSGKKPEQNELFIVEGDSAGGTAKQARNRSFQAILPLRGKPLNAEKKRIDQVLANEEIRTIISALGAGIGEDFALDDLRYHKVIILSDADQDGAHIRAILLTFLFRYMKPLIAGGHVYIGLPPLYKVARRDSVEYVYNDAALDAARQKIGRGAVIQRYKGLGEMSAEQLWSTTMDPNKRTLVQVSIDDAAQAEKMVSILMGDAVDMRKAYIIENADFNKEDAFKSFAK